MFSIIIPLFNKEESVTASIHSVLEQTFEEFELIIVNDGSTDQSVERVQAIEDPRIRLIDQVNQGVSFARNTGISHAKNEYIAFLDADDLWHPVYLQCMSECIRHYPNYQWWGADYISTIGEEAIHENDSKGYAFKDALVKVVDFFEVSRKRYAIHMTSFVARRDALVGPARFPIGFKYYEDLEVFCRLAQMSPLPMIPYVLSYWRQDAENRACNRRKIMPLPPIFEDTIRLIRAGGMKRADQRTQCLFIMGLLLNEVALMCLSGQIRSTARAYARMAISISAFRWRGLKAYAYCWMPSFVLRGLFACTRKFRRSILAD
tara:strand:+ start:970 stop:1926 length:957 start_codon:yes stop_codon:yes gene_type:complete